MDMQGSKIAITLPTGQTVEFELIRVGTVAEYRRLLKDSKTQEAKTKAQGVELHRLAERVRIAETEAAHAKATLAEWTEGQDARKARAQELFAKLDEGKSELSRTIEEFLGIVDEVHGR